MFLRKRFQELDLTIDAFSALQYVGTKTSQPPTNFRTLLLAVKSQLRNISVRSPRKPGVIYNALKVVIISHQQCWCVIFQSKFSDMIYKITDLGH